MSKPTYKKCATAWGYLSYPYLAKPYQDKDGDVYKLELFMPVEDFKKDCQDLMKEVLQCGRDYFNRVDMRLDDFKNPFQLTDTLRPDQRSALPESVRDGHIRIRTKSNYKPIIFGPDGEEMTEYEIEQQITPGDIFKAFVSPYGYNVDGNKGVTLSLSGGQYKQRGPVRFGVDHKEAVMGLVEKVEVDAVEVSPNSAGTVDATDPMSTLFTNG